MARRERFFKDKDLKLVVNDRVLEYLEELAKSGLYGNTHAEAAELLLRQGINQLIEAGKLESLKAKGFAEED
jgi:hypothetical protein